MYKPAMISERAQMDKVVVALDAELTAKGVPPRAFSIEPITFSGNFTGDKSNRNPPQYGFRVTIEDDDYAGQVREAFSMLTHCRDIQPLPLDNKRNAIASAMVDESRSFGMVAGSINALVVGLNNFVLDNARQIGQEKGANSRF